MQKARGLTRCVGTVMSMSSYGKNGKGPVILNMARAQHAVNKGDKLIGLEHYREASYSFEHARDLYRRAGNYELAAVAGVEARAAMKLAKQMPKDSPPSDLPSSEMQAVMIERWKQNIRRITVHKSDAMTLLVDNEKKLAKRF